jgi:hypothetical protein
MLSSLLTKVSFILATSKFYGGVRDCGAGKSLFTMNAISLTPANPVSGQNVTLHIDYTVPASVTVNGGTTQYDLTYNFIPFQPTYEPLCQNVPCPLGPGTYTNSSVSLWPSDISGRLTMKMRWFDLQNVLLQCVEISGQVGDPRKVAVSLPWIQPRRTSRRQKAVLPGRH